MHDSGAERALCADLAHDLGVEFTGLADQTLAAIGEQLDEGLAAGNPLDVWGTGADTRELFGACLQAMVDDPGVAVTALAIDLVSEFDGDTAYADAILDVAATTDAPLAVLASVGSAIDPPTAERLRGNGIPVLENARSGIAALGHLALLAASTDTGGSAASTMTGGGAGRCGLRRRTGMRRPRSNCLPTTASRWRGPAPHTTSPACSPRRRTWAIRSH